MASFVAFYNVDPFGVYCVNEPDVICASGVISAAAVFPIIKKPPPYLWDHAVFFYPDAELLGVSDDLSAVC